MDERDLANKIQEWLALKDGNDKLEKAREDKLAPPHQRADMREKRHSFGDHNELESQSMGPSQPGVSVAGIETRRADPKASPAIAHGYAKVGDAPMHKERAKIQHARILNHIKNTHPNLPKSELEKAGIGIGMGSIGGINMGVTNPFKKKKKNSTSIGIMGIAPLSAISTSTAAGAAVPGAATAGGGISVGKSDEQGVHQPVANDPGKSKAGVLTDKIHAKMQQHKGDESITHRFAKMLEHKRNLSHLKAMSKPNLPKSELEKSDGHHEDIVAGLKVPHELKSHSQPVPREHPHRELAAKFVSDVWKKNKNEGRRMSQKYLGFGLTNEEDTNKKEVQVLPNIISEPVMIDSRPTFTSPQEINGPNTFSNPDNQGAKKNNRLIDIISATKTKNLEKAKQESNLDDESKRQVRMERQDKNFFSGLPSQHNPKDKVLSHSDKKAKEKKGK